ncbi:MAG: endonuclease/exonuclease/phosphatase family protein [Spirulinaceae cyanobacterium SM2_1_0]|nr:endonuclease/exonuclease/phosphatase family protein [Spirulinaceae cyanobacterium SM2_1_0]
MPPIVKVATINILFDLRDWSQRRELLVQGLAAEQPDLIGIQEVKLPENTAAWLAEQLGYAHVQLAPHQPVDIPGIPPYGSAILSRRPFQQQATLDLGSQGRVAQRVQVEVDGHPLVFCNGHYFWYPGPAPGREAQVERLLGWLADIPADCPIIAVGDFNGEPQTPAIARLRQHFTSAYAAHHGHEPDYTCPTPLARRNWRRVVRQIWLDAVYNRRLKSWRGTLDYIFVSPQLQVRDCRIILDQPAPGSRTLYPSDHFGLTAELAWL